MPHREEVRICNILGRSGGTELGRIAYVKIILNRLDSAHNESKVKVISTTTSYMRKDNMAHKKNPVFLRIITNEKAVVCINPLQLSTFQILEKAKLKVKTAAPGGTDEFIFADTIKFYFPSGTGLSYSVGIDITQDEFNYICGTLLEFLYLNKTEFEAQSKAIEQARMDEWNKISEDNSTKNTAVETTIPAK